MSEIRPHKSEDQRSPVNTKASLAMLHALCDPSRLKQPVPEDRVQPSATSAAVDLPRSPATSPEAEVVATVQAEGNQQDVELVVAPDSSKTRTSGDASLIERLYENVLVILKSFAHGNLALGGLIFWTGYLFWDHAKKDLVVYDLPGGFVEDPNAAPVIQSPITKFGLTEFPVETPSTTTSLEDGGLVLDSAASERTSQLESIAVETERPFTRFSQLRTMTVLS